MKTTAREALIAELLGDLGNAVSRTDALLSRLAEVDAKLQASASALDESAGRYRQAVSAATQEARTELANYVRTAAAAATSAAAEEQRTALQEIARTAFRHEAIERAARLADALTKASAANRRSRRLQMVDMLLCSLLAAGLSAIAVALVMH